MPSLVRLSIGLAVALGAASASAPARAADCSGSWSAGYRVLERAGGRPIATWYPSVGPERDASYGGARGPRSRFAPGGEPAACGPVPIVVFSHGFGGCALQSLFLTEELARRGYVVVAPDHRDAAFCGVQPAERSEPAASAEPSLLEPQRWNDRSYRDRRDDIVHAVAAVERDGALRRLADAGRIGVVGHSLGGYTALGVAGAWRSWRWPAVHAVVALSPYVAPFVHARTLDDIGVPVMYQGAVFDWGVTPQLEGRAGVYAQTPAPKYFVKLKGGTHFEWTNLVCAGLRDGADCLAAKPNASLIVEYTVEFLDQELKGYPSSRLRGRGTGLEAYWRDER